VNTDGSIAIGFQRTGFLLSWPAVDAKKILKKSSAPAR
jgi:hypothetical protein